MTKTTDKGIDELIAEEGEVLRAYKDVAGVWTIGVGLTAASGVVKPKSGMTITKAQSRILLDGALARNYEPTVYDVMPEAKPNEFDAAVSFHFNTGKIKKAAWVKSWAAKASDVRAKLLLWNKAGGRVVKGLTARRNREADMLLLGVYPLFSKGTAAYQPTVLQFGDSGDQVLALQQEMTGIGYPVQATGYFDSATDTAVRAFQTAHPDLTTDGKVGPATRAQIDRMLALRGKVETVAVGTAAGGVVAGTDSATTDIVQHATGLPIGWVLTVIAAAGLVWLGVVAWRHRTEIKLLFNKWRGK